MKGSVPIMNDDDKFYIPDGEIVKVPSIWAFEVFTPNNINNFYDSVNELGWHDNPFNRIRNDFSNTLYEFRRKVSGGGWINIGHITNNQDEKNYLRSFSKKAKLPDGVKYITLSLAQSIPSITVLIARFVFEEDLSSLINDSLYKDYKRYREEVKGGYIIHLEENQRSDEVRIETEFLNDVCSQWLKTHFKGFFSSESTTKRHPTALLMTLEKGMPFQRTDYFDNYLNILGLENNYDSWSSKELTNMFLHSNCDDSESVRDSLILSGNIHKMLDGIDLNMYSGNMNCKEVTILNYLTNTLDRTFESWVHKLMIDIYEHEITYLRDSYGKIILDNTDSAILEITKLDHKTLDMQKNFSQMLFELEEQYKSKDEGYNIHQFYRLNDDKKENSFYSSIRNIIIYKTKLIFEQEKIFNNVTKNMRILITAISNNKLSNENSKMQKSMHRLTVIVVILTVVTTISAIK